MNYKWLKKNAAFLLVGCLTAGMTLSGCGDKEENQPTSSTSAEQENEENKSEVTENAENKADDKQETESSDKQEAESGDKQDTETAEQIVTAKTKGLQFGEMQAGEQYIKINVKDFGTMTLRFFPEVAPKAVENFVTHAKDGYYDGITFHRIIDNFMIQGGDPTGTGYGGESIWGPAFEDEFSDYLYPFRGALCMANAGANTNSSQFFIVQAGNQSLLEMSEAVKDYGYESLEQYYGLAYGLNFTAEQMALYYEYGGTPWLQQKHTVFGQLIEGYEVLDAIAATAVDESSRPYESVVIESVEVLTWE